MADQPTPEVNEEILQKDPSQMTPEELDEYLKAISGDNTFSGEVTVKGKIDSPEEALLMQRKQASEISDLISNEEMGKNAGGNAAEAAKRITGISVLGDKYVFVRGLGDRFSNTSLNGSKIPTTEFDKKVVPFDLFPSGLLQKISVSKTYSPDKSGDFVAGLVELETLDFPETQTFSVGIKTKYNSNITGDDFGYYMGGLGFWGSGGQALPPGFPDDKLVRISPITGIGYTPSELEEIGEMLIGSWRATTGRTAGPFVTGNKSAPPGHGFNISYGNSFGNFGLVLSGVYDHNFSEVDEERNFFRYSELVPNNILQRDSYELIYNTEQLKKSLVANFSYKFNQNHELKFNTLQTNLAKSETRLQEGYFDDYGHNMRDFRADYKVQDIVSLQLKGEHFFPSLGPLGSLIEWRAANSEAVTYQDIRMTNYEEGSDGQYYYTDNGQSGFVFTNDLNDKTDDYALDWTTFFTVKNTFGNVKFGVANTQTERDFLGRRVRFKPRGTVGIDTTLPPELLFTAENIRSNGFEIEEITRATDTYFATQDVNAFYGLVDWTFNKFRVITGARFEESSIYLRTLDRQNPDRDPVERMLEGSDILPSLSFIYYLRDNQNLRLSASQTVSRPEFRELAPFRFTAVTGGYEISGNPDLEDTDIRSYDLRWEWFPRPNEVISASLFYKNFERPIEPVFLSSISTVITPQNANSAYNRGIELEARKYFSNFGIIANYSYINSEIELPKDNPQTNDKRPLVGQPDSIGNLILEWENPKTSSNIRLLYNYVGEQIAYAGTYGLPDVIKIPRSTLGVSYSQGLRFLNRDWNLKFSGQNLTDEPWVFTQGGEIYHRWKPGREWSLSVGINF